MNESSTLRYTQYPFYLFVIGIFILIISPTLLSDGMFMDGLIYSTVSHNLSNDIGTFWNPQFTSTCLTDFHEHPPLAFGIQSIFYTVFGDSRYVDKVFSLLTYVAAGFVLIKIWKELNLKHGWIPLLAWLITPLVSWAACNNMLENTLTIFILLSIYFYLKYQNGNKALYLILAGISLAFGFLTKGFVAFFPWGFPFFLWFFTRKTSFQKMTFHSILIILLTLLPLAILVFISPEAKLSLQKYFNIQVVNSLKNIATVDSRFFIVGKLLTELLPLVGIAIIFLIISVRKKISFNLKSDLAKISFAFFALGLAGVLPIMISMKQNGFYILPTFPFFAIGFSLLFYPVIQYLFNQINFTSKNFVLFRLFSYGVITSGIILTIFFANKYGRDENKLHDIYTILPILESGTIVNIHRDMWEDWSLHGYFGRYKNIGLDRGNEEKRPYLLLENQYFHDSLTNNYSMVKLPLMNYKLLKHK